MKTKDEIKALKEEIKELHSIIGLMRTRPEYLEAVKLWRKDTGHNKLTYPDLGEHWAWALKYIKGENK